MSFAIFSRFRVLPVTIIAALMMLGVRIGDLWQAVEHGGGIVGVSQSMAQTAPAAPAAARPAVPAAAPAGPAARQPVDVSDAQAQLLQDLGKRRDALDQRAHALDQREALLSAAEKRVEQKVAELTKLKGDIQAMLSQLDAKHQAQLDSLVKIYETMKPTDAARIFNQLQMPVLLEVVQQMKATKTAPILAAMDPQKAQAVTMALAERKPLPVSATN